MRLRSFQYPHQGFIVLYARMVKWSSAKCVGNVFICTCLQQVLRQLVAVKGGGKSECRSTLPVLHVWISTRIQQFISHRIIAFENGTNKRRIAVAVSDGGVGTRLLYLKTFPCRRITVSRLRW